jgi:hypothetical protein
VRELLRSNDAVGLSFLRPLPRRAGIDAISRDLHMCVLEGPAAALPCRLMVAEEDEAQGQRVLHGVGEWTSMAG